MKKGASHIEIILAFILFIGFVVIGFYFFSPQSSRLAESSLSYSLREIIQNTTIPVTTYGVRIEEGSHADDVIPIDVMVSAGRKVRAEDDSGILKARIGSQGVTYVQLGPNMFVTLEYADDLPAGSEPADVVAQPGKKYYSLASTREENIMSEKRIRELNQTYFAHYEDLKKEFNLPDRVDFGFNIRLQDMTITSMPPIPGGVNIYSTNVRVEVLRENGEREFSDLVVSVW
ncbi:hypothetical protein KW805_03110 [Candidatus Pacearchaeota archaeon]|nr:hypothetical protein [Candidatus Pacearchaeota archaeon]